MTIPDLKLTRPLAVFDIEATGTDAQHDRIIELAIIKLMPDREIRSRIFVVNPGIPIPPEASAIHGFRDEDVKDKPTFREVAGPILLEFEGCDLAGYNILRYDIPLLEAEFRRVGVDFPMDGRRIVDAQRIFHLKEPRDLTAAVAFYCGKTLTGAHGAEADARATLDVLMGQLQRYADLPRDIEGLDAFCAGRSSQWVDRAGRFKWVNGEIVVNFSKNRGQPLRKMVETNPGFLRWILDGHFPADTKAIVRNALKGVYPSRPPAPEAEADDSGS